MAALIIGASGPTKITKKIILSMVIRIDANLPRFLVRELIITVNRVIFIPDKTTIWSNPTVLRLS